MKNLLLAAILLLGIASCTPVKYVMIDPKDSTKLVEVRKRIIYDDVYMDPMPFRYNNWWLYTPPVYSPRIVIQRRQPIVVHPKRVQTPSAPIRRFEPRKR
jgi:hypothetical protein